MATIVLFCDWDESWVGGPKRFEQPPSKRLHNMREKSPDE